MLRCFLNCKFTKAQYSFRLNSVLRIPDGLVWTVGLTVEIKLLFLLRGIVDRALMKILLLLCRVIWVLPVPPVLEAVKEER